AALMLYAKLALTPERVRQTLVVEAARYLRREVSFKDVQVSLLDGIHIKEAVLRRSLPWEEDDIFTCPEITIQVRFLPLVLGKLFIKEIICDSPRMYLFQGGIGQFPSLYGQAANQMILSVLRQKPPFGIVFLPGHVEIRNGAVLYKNSARELPRPLTFSLEQVQVLVTGVSPVFSFPFSMSARVAGAGTSVFACKGEISVPRQKLSATISLGNTDLSMFKDYAAWYGIPLHKGFMQINSSVEMEKLQSLKMSGALQLSDISIEVGSLVTNGSRQPVNIESLDATLNFVSLWDIPAQLVTFQKLDGMVVSAPYSGEGFIRDIGVAPFLKVSLRADNFPMENVFKRLPQKLPWMLDEASLSGKADLALQVEGKLPDGVDTRFKINFRGNSLNYPPLGGFQPDFEGTAFINNNKIALSDLKIGIRKSTITLAGEVLNYLQGAPQSSIKVVSSHLNISDFFLPGETTAEEAEKLEMGPFDLKGLTLGGPLDLGSVSFLEMMINNLKGNYALENNKFYLKDVSGDIGEGRFKLSGTVDLGVKGLDYALNVNLDQASLKTLSTMISPFYSSFAEGTVSGTCTLNGNGVTAVRFMKNLKGGGVLTMRDALVKGLPSMGTIASFLRMDGHEGFRFDQAQVQYKVHDGTLDIDGGFSNQDLGFYPSGQMGLDGSLNIDTTMKISPHLAEKMVSERIRKYLPQEDGWIVLPVEVRGTVDNPRIALKKEVMDIFVEKVLPEVLNDLLQEKKGKDSGSSSSE
ncbi:MAG: DUF748 domain-containing protein, partial [Proteobacteria bacterium]|nr:DUF748 domain-containing protein [Pseudomonadota bacterium]